MIQELLQGVVTVLFSDVIASTDLTVRQADEMGRDTLGAQRELARQQVEQHSGQSATKT